MRESRTYGSVRGAPSDGRPYRVLFARPNISQCVRSGVGSRKLDPTYALSRRRRLEAAKQAIPVLIMGRRSRLAGANESSVANRRNVAITLGRPSLILR